MGTLTGESVPDLLGDVAQRIVAEGDPERFWARQVGTYSTTDMTNGNVEELAAVEALCEEFVARGYVAQDIVTFGGANGYRDPRIAVDKLRQLGQCVESIIFNDLAQDLIEEALAGHLAHYPALGIPIEAMPGPAHEVANKITPMPRRVIIGVYSSDAFIAGADGDPGAGGLAEYLRNYRYLGDEFFIQPFHISGSRYEDMHETVHIRAKYSETLLQPYLAILRKLNDRGELGAIRVIGRHVDQEGHFLSHWFTKRGITELVRACFAPTRAAVMTVHSIPKGLLLCIDPTIPARGIITLLNNVVGNIASDFHAPTLRAVDRIST